MSMNMGSFASRVVATRVVALDGTGDFTEIQPAIDDLPAGGGVVYVKEGAYETTATITIPSDNISLIGAGRSTIIRPDSVTGISANNQLAVTIEGIYFDGTNAGALDNAILLTGASTTDCFIRACWFSNFTSDCIFIHTNATRISILECFFITNGAAGVHSITDGRILVNSCFFEDCWNSISVGNSDASVINNNIIISDSSDSIYIPQDTSNIIITNNVCSSGTGSGIRLVGVGIMPNENNIVMNNVCKDNTGWGIRISTAATFRTIIVGNQCYNNTAGQIQDLGTDSQIGHNITL